MVGGDGASLDVVGTDLGSMTASCVLRLLTARRRRGGQQIRQPRCALRPGWVESTEASSEASAAVESAPGRLEYVREAQKNRTGARQIQTCETVRDAPGCERGRNGGGAA